jgi:hypothetical protein
MTNQPNLEQLNQLASRTQFQDDADLIRETVRYLTKLNEYLDIAGGISCPDCDDSGGYPVITGTGESNLEQCQFCYECPDSVFNRKNKT